MTNGTAKYQGPLVPVRYLITDLRIFGAHEKDYLYPLIYTYAARCEEKLEGHLHPGTQDIVLEMSERAQRAFAQSVRKFSEKFGPIIRNWGVTDPSGIAKLFGRFLEAGNYPDDSPYVIRKNLMDRFAVFEEVFSSQAEDIGNNQPEEIMHYETAREEIEQIQTGLDERLFEDDELAALSGIADLLDSGDVEKRKMGTGLIVLLALTKGNSPSLPSYILKAAEVSKGFEPLHWGRALAHGFRNMVIKRSIYSQEWEWEDALRGAAIETSRGNRFVFHPRFDLPDSMGERVDRVHKSVLALLSRGEIDLARVFAGYIMDWGAPSGVEESLLHISAFIKMNDVRRQLIDRALRIFESNDLNGYMERPLADHIAALLSYQENNDELEGNLLSLIDKLVYSRILDTGFHEEEEDEFVTDFIRAILDMYDNLFKRGLMQYERDNIVSKSAAAKAVEIAANQRLNHIREFLLHRALDEIKRTGGEGGWDFLEPMLLSEEQERIDSTDKSPYEYWSDFLRRKKKEGTQGGGSASNAGTSSVTAGSGNPGTGSMSSALSPALSNCGIFSDDPLTPVNLFTGLPVISTVNLMLSGAINAHL
jgi:hypothetical protein